MQRINDHKVSHSAIQNFDFSTMMEGEKASIFYSDPPWGDGNMKYWATLAKKQNNLDEKPDQISYAELIELYRQLIVNHVDGFVFIETGLKWEAEFIEMMQTCLSDVKRVTMRYSGGDCVLMYGNTRGIATPTMPVADATGATVSKICITAVAERGGIVLDPCCGMGYTAKATMLNGMRFYGNELNASRLQKTIEKLNKGK